MEDNRRRRIRFLVKNLNKARKIQSGKIDMLCNDMVQAHKHFINTVKTLNFTSSLYEALLGRTQLNDILSVTADFITSLMPQTNFGFILAGAQAFELHRKNIEDLKIDQAQLAELFNARLIEEICQSNRVCLPHDLVAGGLPVSPATLNQITMAAAPISWLGPAVGIIVLYRQAALPFRPDELAIVSAVTPGLANAIRAFRHLNVTA